MKAKTSGSAQLADLYRSMARARAFELCLAGLWEQGLISGEMHLGTGEEAVVAGVLAHHRPEDAVALDHRPTPALAMLGVDLASMLREMLGREDGLCRGRGGHIHLFSPERLAASSGIVGAAGPTAAGFALAAKLLRPGSVALAFFGDGAANQGMLLESMNLAVAWSLPLVFVCKDNGWAITTRSKDVTGGDLLERARAFGLAARSVDGLDVDDVCGGARELVERARAGKGPGFLLAQCSRLDGHFLGDPMRRVASDPLGAEGKQTLGKVVSAVLASGGGGAVARAGSVLETMNLLRLAGKEAREGRHDPLVRARARLGDAEADRIDGEARAEIAAAATAAMGAGGAP